MSAFPKWSVWLASLDPVVGSEQGKTRPVVVVSEEAVNELLPVLNVLPITSRKPGRRVYPNEALLPAGNFGLTNESIAMAYQIRTLDKRRLLKRLGLVDRQTMQKEIFDAIRFQLGID